uniref:Cytochrome c oxidase subunit 3 n=1 Tax=Scydmaeninae sp. 840218 TaxID=1213605 RepID=A0A0S2MP63_9COLE|nr:cytochrome c oxidase subunit 3 [Scydmaeninae sp. 840218]
MMKNHPFHLVDYSPWPIMGSLSTMIMMMGLINWFSLWSNNLFLLGITTTIMVMIQWWRDITRESTFQGLHTILVTKGLKWGMILFIISEVMFFFSFFWSFFHNSLTPNIELGMNWPPMNINPFDPIKIPLLNTLILLTSGFSVTWAHHSMIDNNFKQTKQGLMITVSLGIYFSILQYMEYTQAPFTMADSSYGSSFFMSTGFHGLHVLIGTTFLLISLTRMMKNHLSKIHHFGFEAAAWYWHFVDIVWLFLYSSVYWWGSY